jgi:hypothetical protein
LDVLPRLLAHNVDVVGGVYYGRTNSGNGDEQTAVVWKHKTDFNKRKNLEQLTGLQEVDGMGMDCVLFSRAVLESFSFLDHVQNDDDYPIYDKLKEKNCKIWLDTSVVCRHYYSKDKYN